MRLNKNGTRDPAFGEGGQVTILPGGRKETDAAVSRDLEIDRQGRILLTGFVSPRDFDDDPGYGLVMRFLPDGVLDRSFGKKGTVRLYASPKAGGRATRLYDIQTDTEGGIWVTGSAGRSARSERRAIAVRLFESGRKDVGFFRKGVLKIQFGQGSVGTGLVRRGTKMYLSGRYDQGSLERYFLMRLKPSR